MVTNDGELNGAEQRCLALLRTALLSAGRFDRQTEPLLDSERPGLTFGWVGLPAANPKPHTALSLLQDGVIGLVAGRLIVPVKIVIGCLCLSMASICSAQSISAIGHVKADASLETSVTQVAITGSQMNTTRFSATGLPPGLSIDPKSGVISGVIDRAASISKDGIFRVVVTVRDALGGFGQTPVNLKVANAPPEANDDRMTVARGEQAALNVFGNDDDPDRDALRLTSAAAEHGTVVCTPDGMLVYLAQAEWIGSDRIIYSSTDDHGGQATATIIVNQREY